MLRIMVETQIQLLFLEKVLEVPVLITSLLLLCQEVFTVYKLNNIHKTSNYNKIWRLSFLQIAHYKGCIILIQFWIVFNSLSIDLLKGAISQSGVMNAIWAHSPKGNAKKLSNQVAKIVGCTSGPSLDCLPSVEAANLIAAELHFIVRKLCCLSRI